METVHYNVISILVQLRIKNTGWELRSNIYLDLFRYDDHYLNISGRKSICIAYSRLKWVERHPDYGGSLLGIHDKLSSRSLPLSHTTNFCLVGIIAINIIAINISNTCLVKTLLFYIELFSSWINLTWISLASNKRCKRHSV